MRVHIVAPGFTPEVFTSDFGKETAPILRIGVDKLVTIHSPFPSKQVEKQVTDTIQALEKTIGIRAEQRILHGKEFVDLVKEIRVFLESFGDADDIYLHLEGGERHVCLAMAYASFFVKKRIQLIFVTEYGGEDRQYRFQEMPPVPAYELTDKQRDVLALVAGKDGQTLTELSARVNAQDPSRVAPGVHRHLKRLMELHLVAVSANGKKTYSATSAGHLFLN